MLFYFIPFLLLLVVALVLKQRERQSASSGQEKNNKVKVKTAPVKSNKKSAAKNRRAAAAIEQAAASESPESTAVAPVLLQKLQQLIHGGHYSTAEAQINQELNRDDKQHELYLLLLKLHLLQKDELATNQLLNYIRGLKLPALLAEAENKRQEFEQMQSIEHDFLQDHVAEEKNVARAAQSFDEFQLLHKSKQSSETIQADNATNSSNAEALSDFDFSQFDFNPSTHTSASAAATLPPSSTATELTLNPSNFSAAAHADTTANEDHFNFKLQDETLTQSPQENDTALQFSFSDNVNSSPSVEQSSNLGSKSAHDDDLSLNFSLEPNFNDAIIPASADVNSALSQTTANTSQAASNEADLEFEHFSFSLTDEPENKTALEAEQFKTPLDFSLMEATTFAALSFNLADTAPDATASSNHAALNFSLDEQETPSKTLSLLAADDQAEQPALQLSPSTTDHALAFTQNQATEEDELVQQFPQLKHLNQVQLDLDLAQQYVEFAAFDAARSLCNALTQQSLTAVQQQQLQTLQQQLQTKPAVTTH